MPPLVAQADVPDHPLLRLGASGLRHAARLRHLPATTLARRTYAYNALPLGRAEHCRLRGWPEVAEWLGLGASSPANRRLDDAFLASPDPDGHWMHWRRPAATSRLLHKLYVSPRPEVMPRLLPMLVETFVARDVPAFKIGANARALLRPDKFVAYFASREHLVAIADELAVCLRHQPVHGVPFTSPLDETGVLSWGYDPAAEGGSWRLWIAQTLASAIATAPPGSTDDVVAHARQALRSHGVDAVLWEPIGYLAP